MKILINWIAIALIVLGSLNTTISVSANPSLSLAQVLQKFEVTSNLSKKEQLLNQITDFPEVGKQLLHLSETTKDVSTKWMSIRGLGKIKYKKATPLLITCLNNESNDVRASAARALGELKAKSAAPELITLLRQEKDGGVIEQISLALVIMQAKEAIPSLKQVALRTSGETLWWVLQSIGELGSKDDVDFLAHFLFSPQITPCQSAAEAISAITKVDFGFPKSKGVGSLIWDPTLCIKRAQQWWEKNKTEFCTHDDK